MRSRANAAIATNQNQAFAWPCRHICACAVEREPRIRPKFFPPFGGGVWGRDYLDLVSYPAPKSPRGEGSGDIGTISWLHRRVISCQCYAINHVPVPRCYAMQCAIKELRSHWLALNRQLTLHDRCCATRCKVT